MKNESESPESRSARDAEYDAHRRQLYELIGHCITSYQSVEDYLPDLFAAALGGDDDQSLAIFSAVRGIETKLALIDAALLRQNEDRRREWNALRRAIGDACVERGQIAHSQPTSVGHVTIIVSPEGGDSRVSVGDQWMETRKTTKSGELAWTVEKLRSSHRGLRTLFSAQIAFVQLLRGEDPTEHLLVALNELLTPAAR
jgi:hypothetical protein